MFFSIATTKDDRFPNHAQLDGWILSMDDGWRPLHHGGWYKGFRHSSTGYGIWTEIHQERGTVRISHGPVRGYPLWWNRESKVLTNLCGSGMPLWSDDRVCLVERDIQVEKISIIPNDPLRSQSFEEACLAIENDLLTKTQHLFDDFEEWPKKLFVTGGIDTLLLLGLCSKQNKQAELLDHEFFQYDYFCNRNISEIRKKHWAYNQLHHWTHDTILLTGSQGDEFLFRGPNIAALWCAWHDIDLAKLLINSRGYHAKYFLKEKNLKLFTDAYRNKEQIRELMPTKQELINKILDINANDFQHWHLGKTITWTPYADLMLTKTILSMNEEDVISQILDAKVNKKILSSLNHKFLSMLSNFKNIDPRANVQTHV